jgi:hypothetical protein
MRVESSDGHNFLEISRGNFEDPVDLNISVRAASFSGRTSNIFALNTTPFLRDLDLLEKSRHGTAKLEGTEEFVLSFQPYGHTGAIWASVSISQFRPAPLLANPTWGDRLDCGFEIPGESFGKLCTELRQVLCSDGDSNA